MIDIDLNNLPNYQINDYRYEKWFESIHPNGVTMNVMQRREFIQMIDSHVALNSEFINFIVNNLKTIEGLESEYYTIDRVILNAWLFVAQTTADCMVACKYFLLADTGYDRRYMRGKLKVILNEGIKQLIGFKTSAPKETVWGSISGIMKHFVGPVPQHQYNELDMLLRNHVMQSSWWKEDRDAETHLSALDLYSSRQKDLDESTVMIESLRLTGALDAVNHFLQNIHACLTNWLNNLYRNHPELFKEA